MAFVLVSPTLSFASTTNTGPNTPTPATHTAPSPAVRLRIPVKQNATWLAAKNSYRIVSGINPYLPIKGQKITPRILRVGVFNCPASATGHSSSPNTTCGTPPPSSYKLTQDSYNLNTWEPSDGTTPNAPNSTDTADDLGDIYNSMKSGVPSNHDFFDLCGPGATDIALDFWPAPPNLLENVTDDPGYDKAVHYNNGSTLQTYWNGLRMRGYMTYLAWQTQPPDWPTAGMMDTSTFPSNGVTEYDVLEALNWEASGHNVSDWQNYFYTITWLNPTSVTADTLNHDVVADVGVSHVPVVAEVNATLLKNWAGASGLIKHQIAIIGYDNVNKTYTYVDTCAHFTGCNGYDATDNEHNAHTIPQAQMWQAIAAVPVNTSPLPQYGDGGWVW